MECCKGLDGAFAGKGGGGGGGGGGGRDFDNWRRGTDSRDTRDTRDTRDRDWGRKVELSEDITRIYHWLESCIET